jgi:hypothetical protein
MIKTFGPLLVETANLVGGRRTIIVNVCSFTIHGVPWYSAYISSKVSYSIA